MADNLRVEYLSHEHLRKRAAEWLLRYHSSGAIPVPIEEIIDVQLKIDIVPVPGLRGSFDVEAFITSDMTAIYVDEHIYQHVENRYRFSLAHEIAHAVLHQKVFRQFSFGDIAGWKAMQRSLPEREYQWLEWQAYAFAGLLLVPSDALAEQFRGAIKLAEEVGVSLQAASEVAQNMVAGSLARVFKVSTSVVEKRLAAEKLWQS